MKQGAAKLPPGNAKALATCLQAGDSRFVLAEKGFIETQNEYLFQQLANLVGEMLNLASPTTKTIVPRIAGIEFELGREGPVDPSQCWTSIDQKTTGIVREKLNQNLSRNMAKECPACRSWFPWALAFCDRHVGYASCLWTSCVTWSI
jgi:hypothetical protein